MTTSTAFPVKLASPAQINFIESLRKDKDVPIVLGDVLSQALTGIMTSKQASVWIDTLKLLPRKPVVATPADSGYLEGVEESKYAVRSAELSMIPGLKIEGDLLFLEVRTYMGKKYIRRLHGAPGGFWRSKFTFGQARSLAAVIAGRHIEYARLFGEHYTCCGRCGAELTDQKSRETFLGPTCRKVFGL